MQYRQLGDSGLTVSVVGLGANNFGGRLNQEQTTAVVHAVIDAGTTQIDTAEVYGGGGVSEQMIFPEIEPDKVNFTQGMDITIVTSTPNDDEARELLKLFGMPFREA